MTEKSRKPIVAIDGPAGAGKSTAAAALANRLGFTLIDTGALYRAVAWAARTRGISFDDGAALGELAGQLELRFGASGARPPLLIDGEDRSAEIREPDISQGASKVSAHPEVRAALLNVQREMGREGGVVLEGRDIGTVVFPDAELKVFLTADVHTRAMRRFEELVERGVDTADLGAVEAEIAERDARDSQRDVAPLRPAEGAVVLDSTRINLDGVVERLARMVEGAAPAR